MVEEKGRGAPDESQGGQSRLPYSESQSHPLQLPYSERHSFAPLKPPVSSFFCPKHTILSKNVPTQASVQPLGCCCTPPQLSPGTLKHVSSWLTLHVRRTRLARAAPAKVLEPPAESLKKPVTSTNKSTRT